MGFGRYPERRGCIEAVIFGVVIFFAFTCGLAIGVFYGHLMAKHRRYLEERALLMPILAADPAFARVEVGEYSDGGAYLVGEVPTARDLDRLSDRVARTLGESRAQDALPGVAVNR